MGDKDITIGTCSFVVALSLLMRFSDIRLGYRLRSWDRKVLP